MAGKKLIKLELRNSRFQKNELKDHASEFILYSRYSGMVLDKFNEHLRDSKLVAVKSDFMESFKLEVETTVDNARILNQLTKLYPSFANWRIKPVTKGVDITALPSPPSKPKKKKIKPAKPAAKKKAPKPKAKTKPAVSKKTLKKAAKKSAKKAEKKKKGSGKRKKK
jgi:hypothetical protein